MYYSIVGKRRWVNPWLKLLGNYNLRYNKHIPDDYLFNSTEVRLAVLAGLIDTDGHNDKNTLEIIQKNVTLADGITFLARSLGFHCTRVAKRSYCTYKGEKRWGIYQRMHISGSGFELIPTRIPRKQFHCRQQRKNVLVTGMKLGPTTSGEFIRIQTDGNQRILRDDFLVLTCAEPDLLLPSSKKRKKPDGNETIEEQS